MLKAAKRRCMGYHYFGSGFEHHFCLLLTYFISDIFDFFSSSSSLFFCFPFRSFFFHSLQKQRTQNARAFMFNACITKKLSHSNKYQNSIVRNRCCWLAHTKVFARNVCSRFCVCVNYVCFEWWFSSIRNFCIINNNRVTSHIQSVSILCTVHKRHTLSIWLANHCKMCCVGHCTNPNHVSAAFWNAIFNILSYWKSIEWQKSHHHHRLKYVKNTWKHSRNIFDLLAIFFVRWWPINFDH